MALPLVVVVPDAYTGNTPDPVTKAMKAWANYFMRLSSNARNSESAKGALRAEMVAVASKNALAWPKGWDRGEHRPSSVIYHTMETVFPYAVAYAQFKNEFSPSEQKIIETWLGDLVDRLGRSKGHHVVKSKSDHRLLSVRGAPMFEPDGELERSMRDENPIKIEIDIVSDIVCPWCVVGYKQLEQALADTGLTASIQWHPFELNPQMPPEGQNLREHIAEKYGSTPEDSQRARDRLTELGATLGFTFRFDDSSRMVNTFKAHQLIEWADEQGRQHDMKMALFAAHFSDARNVSDINVLADIAAGIGLDKSSAHDALIQARFAPAVRTMQKFWIERGIRGVPAMVFQKQHLITGAQGVETYAGFLKQLVSEIA